MDMGMPIDPHFVWKHPTYSLSKYWHRN